MNHSNYRRNSIEFFSTACKRFAMKRRTFRTNSGTSITIYRSKFWGYNFERLPDCETHINSNDILPKEEVSILKKIRNRVQTDILQTERWKISKRDSREDLELVACTDINFSRMQILHQRIYHLRRNCAEWILESVHPIVEGDFDHRMRNHD